MNTAHLRYGRELKGGGELKHWIMFYFVTGVLYAIQYYESTGQYYIITASIYIYIFLVHQISWHINVTTHLGRIHLIWKKNPQKLEKYWSADNG